MPPPPGAKPQEMRYSYHPGGYEKGICFTAVGDKNSRGEARKQEKYERRRAHEEMRYEV